VKGRPHEDIDIAQFSATLRIHGMVIPFDEITEQLGVKPTLQRRKGE